MLYTNNKVNRFVILFEGRTGSSYLITSLDSHPKVRANGEVLTQFKQAGHAAQVKRTNEILATPLFGRNKAIGFKTKLRDIADPTSFARLLQNLNVLIFHMQRRNRVKTAISEVNCNILKEKTNQYQVYKPGDRLPAHTIPLEDFSYALNLREKLDGELNQYIDNLELEVCPIYYEDMLTDEDGFMKNIYEKLGVLYIKTSGNTLKNTSDDLRKSILNIDELRDAYKGTMYESMFDEILINGKSFT